MNLNNIPARDLRNVPISSYITKEIFILVILQAECRTFNGCPHTMNYKFFCSPATNFPQDNMASFYSVKLRLSDLLPLLHISNMCVPAKCVRRKSM
jgi:hypothetical protein